MLDFLKKNKDTSEASDNTATTAKDVTSDDTDGSSSQGPDVVDGVPVKLSEKLAEIRGDVDDTDVEYHELDDDGKVKLGEDGKPIVITDPDAEEISGAKDGDTSSGDATKTLDTSETDTSVAEADTDNSGDVVLDPRLEAVGARMGWSKDKVILIAKTDKSILEDLANRFEANDTHRQEDVVAKDGEDTQESDSELTEEAIAKLKEKLGDDAANIIIGMKKENQALSKKLKDVDDYTAKTKEDAETMADARRYEVASELFDNNQETFPEFGKTSELPLLSDGKTIDVKSAQMAARNKVYDVAEMFQNKNGGTFAAAMNDALTWYAGKTGVDTAHRQVVADLNKQKKRFSPKPSRRKMVKVFKNKEAKGADIVRQAKKAAGIT